MIMNNTAIVSPYFHIEISIDMEYHTMLVIRDNEV